MRPKSGQINLISVTFSFSIQFRVSLCLLFTPGAGHGTGTSSSTLLLLRGQKCWVGGSDVMIPDWNGFRNRTYLFSEINDSNSRKNGIITSIEMI